MLRSVKQLLGYRIEATDGHIGHVQDFYFDDLAWRVRYLVVDTGTWLPGRRVLLAPIALEQPAWHRKVFPVRLTKEQVENSPDISTDLPVSRQHEVELFRYYAWPLYWGGDDVAGPAAVPILPPPEAEKIHSPPVSRGDPHLRSAREIVGYHIRASDGSIGHVADLMLDDEAWAIQQMVVDTSNWPGGRRILLAPKRITRLDWTEQNVYVDLSRDQVRNSPEFHPEELVRR